MQAEIARKVACARLAGCLVASLVLAGCIPVPEPIGASSPAASHAGESSHVRHHGHLEGDSAQPRERDEPVDLNTPPSREGLGRESTAGGIPAHVSRVLRYIDEHHRAPDGYEGGRVFHNAGRDGEHALPRTDAGGKAVTYHEWDVHPKEPGVNRGAERLVTGSDGSAYYTTDHYRTFRKLR